MSSALSPHEAAVANTCNHGQLSQQWKTLGALAFSFLSFIDALYTAKRERLTIVMDALLTGAQATAIVSVVCAAYLVWKHKDRDVELSRFVTIIPAVACYVSGTLLIVVTCMGRWKATCAAVGLIAIFLFAANAAKMKAFGARAVQCCINIIVALGAVVAQANLAVREMRRKLGASFASVGARLGDQEGGIH